jgi:pimeloyl-ACP methyl ester carboxylesterase
MGSAALHRGYVDAPLGQIHYAEVGQGPAVLLYPNRPRSWVIYRRLAGLLSERHRTLVIDPPGFGASDPLPRPFEIEDLTGAVVRLLDALGVERVRMSGHHTGATMCVDLAVTHPDRVDAIAPTGLPVWTDEERGSRLDGSTFVPASGNPPKEDGAHLLPLLKRFPPKPFEDQHFMTEWLVDSLASEPEQAASAAAVHRYPIEERLRQLRVPTLVVQSSGPGEPPYLQRAERARELIPGGCRIATFEGAEIHFIHHRADELSRLLLDFFAQSAAPHASSAAGSA